MSIRYAPRVPHDEFIRPFFSLETLKKLANIINRRYPGSVTVPKWPYFFRRGIRKTGRTDTQLLRFSDTLEDGYKSFMQIIKNDVALCMEIHELITDLFKASGAVAVFGLGSYSIMNTLLCGEGNVMPRGEQGDWDTKDKNYKECAYIKRNHSVPIVKRNILNADVIADNNLSHPGIKEAYERLRQYEGQPIIIFDDSIATGLAKDWFMAICKKLNISTDNMHFLSLIREG